ncbi:SPT3 Dosage dependent suppressor of Ty-induced promoter mutations-like protein, partial [Coemansia spiralis]
GPGLLDTASLVSQLNGLSASAVGQQAEPVQVGQVIPTQGPIVGGVRVMITGRGFHPNLDVYFGDVRAGHVSVEPSSITCILPPTRNTGVVPIHILDRATMYEVGGGGQPPLFTYIEDTDQALIDLGAQAVGLRGQDGTDVSGLLPPEVEAALQTMYTASGKEKLKLIESSLVDLINIQVGQGRVDASQLRLRHESTGRRLVHFAALLGMYNLMVTLTRYGCNLDDQDHNDMTALHFSCMFERFAVIELLLRAGAAHTLRSYTGQSAADMLRDAGLTDMLVLIEERVGYLSFIRDDQADDAGEADGVPR